MGAVCGALALALPYAAGWASPAMSTIGANNGAHPSAGSVVGTVVEVAPMMGLFFLGLAVALAWRGPGEFRRVGRVEMVPVVLAVMGLGAGAVYVWHFGVMVWPGNVFGNWGLGPTFIGGAKPTLVPVAAFLALELAALLAAGVILVRRRRAWAPANLGAAGSMVVALALLHLLPMPLRSPLDRYYLAVAAPLAPVLAAMATAAQRGFTAELAARAWAVAVLAASMVFFAVSQADYLAWQESREAVAQLAYRGQPASMVDSGYESVAVHVAMPRFASGVPIGFDAVDMHPPHPRLVLLFAASDDRRPGVTWQSIAPGKIVLSCARGTAIPDLNDLAGSCP